MNAAGLNSYMPSDFSPAWSVLAPVISKVFPAGPQVCFGDFPGSAFDENDDLGSDLCNTIPVESSGTFAVIGTSLSGLACGKPTDLSMCVTFDKCGTFGIAFNLGVPACLAYYGGAFSGVIAAIGAATSLVADVVGNFSLGISLGRRFTTDVRVAYRDGDKVHSGTITTYGHMFLDVGINFPTDFLKFGKRDLSDYFSITADILFLIDFGDVDTIAISMINTLRNANKDTAKTLMNSILKSGAEITLNIDGVMALNLEDMTKGLLCDFSFTLASATVLLTGGSGRSGLEAGVYFRLGSNVISDMINSLQGIFDNFSDIFKKIGMGGSFTLPSVGIELGLFLTTSAFGFQFTVLGFTFKCMFLYDGGDFSCAINAKIFTIIMDGLNFVFKNASKFFDKTGSIIATKAAAEFRAATKLVSKGIKEATGFVKNSSGTLVKLGTVAFTDLYNQYDEELKWMKNGYKNVSKRAVKIAGEAAKVALKKGELAACDIKHALNKKKRRKCKNSVKNKYNNDSNNQSLSCNGSEYSETSYRFDGDGNILTLAEHPMDCGSGKFLNEFKIERQPGVLRYRYKCVDPSQASSTCVVKTTGVTGTNTSDLSHSANYLDRQTVKCDSAYGLSKVSLKRSTTNTSNIYYEYTCCTLPSGSTCTDTETQNDDMGDKSTYNLDRLDVDAGKNRIISGFKLNSSGDNQWNYSFQSCGVPDKIRSYYDSGCDSESSGSIFALTKHKVSCDEKHAISQFQLRRENGQIRYDYKCIYSIQISDECTSYSTAVNETRTSDSNKSGNYLDRHNVNCPLGSVLSAFQLMRSGSTSIYYDYKCCKANIVAYGEITTSTEDAGDFQSYNLSKINLDATASNALTRFKLTINSNKDWFYSASICKLA
jgi:hypothetical protein